MATVVLDHVSKVYGGVAAVDDIRLRADDGELLVLLGPSGSGKTTVLRIIAGLEEPVCGDVWLGGQLATALPPHERNVAMIFQDGALYPHCSVRDNLAFPLRIAGAEKAAVDARVLELARGLGLEGMLERRPGSLSGGERQRVALGRALIRGEPQVLLMDEPLASLDTGLRSELRAEIAALVRSLALTTVYVTHDQAEALSMADRLAVMRDGRLEDVGAPAAVYQSPATAFVAAFLSSPPISLAWADVRVETGERVVVDFGSQQVGLEWTHPRAETLAMYHQDSVIVGIRPEALTLSRPGAAGSVLRGKVSSVEYQGHEWLARIEVGFRPVDLDLVSPPPRRTVPSPIRRPASRRSEAQVPPAGAGPRGEHRSALLSLRLSSSPGWITGQETWVNVDMRRAHFFDSSGRRISETPRRPAGRQLPIALLGDAPG